MTESPLRVFPAGWGDLEVHLCHDWLTGMRGGERCLEILCAGFPRAPVSTLICKADAISETIRRHEIRTSWLQRIPGIFASYRNYLPLFPAAIRSLPPARGRLLISTSHCVAKAHRRAPGARHLCYCFTPMRYAWSFHEDYFAGSRLKRALAAPVLAALRKWDRATAANVDLFVAISAHVRDRIHRFYGRDAEVVHPPADTDFFTPGPPGHDGYDLIVSALVPYKRVDIALDAYTRLGTPLKIVGVGTEADRLRARAGANVEFLGWKSDPEVRELYRRCRRLVFPGEEDFGIVPVEAMACGKPVVALARGGVTETVTDGISGLFFAEQTPAALAAAVEEAGRRTWDPAAIRAQALRFGVDAFIAGMERCIRKCLDGDRG